MKKIILSLFIFSAILTQSIAQEVDNSYFGVKAGANMSTIDWNLDDYLDSSTDYKYGFAGGIYYNIGIGNIFSIQPELLYSQMGSELGIDLDIVPVNKAKAVETTEELQLDYISVPVLFKISPIWRLGIFAGPQFDYLLMAEIDGDDLEEDFEDFDFAATAGLEFWLTRNIGLYGRYIWGLTDIYAGDGNDGDIEINNQGWQVGLTIGFRSKMNEAVVAAPVVAAAVVADPDRDGDGVLDKNDACPDVAGTVALAGCPDTDGDGIIDRDDQCPKEFGTAALNGCPVKDADGDGIVDTEDQCPTVAGNADNKGCPGLTVEAQKQITDLARAIYFNTGKSTFTTETMVRLEGLNKIMSGYPNLKFRIEGHTDSTGSKAVNDKLSQARADAVMKYLVDNGISAGNMRAVGYGSANPIGDNATNEGRQANRRVDIYQDK
jgi:outer membrane protein OmpA-like peptidoglycan-associated protein